MQGQIQAATGRGAQGGQQGLQGLQGLGRQQRKLGGNRLQLRRNGIGVVMAWPVSKPPVSPMPVSPSCSRLTSRCSTAAVVPRLMARGTALVS